VAEGDGGKTGGACFAGSVVTDGGGTGVSWDAFFAQPVIASMVTAAAVAIANETCFIILVTLFMLPGEHTRGAVARPVCVTPVHGSPALDSKPAISPSPNSISL
jgi:hypothetical protein